MVVALTIFLTLSCTKEQVSDENNKNEDYATFSNPNQNTTHTDVQETVMALGNKLPNPYNTDTMKHAALKVNGSNNEVVTNNLYVRFLPEDVREIKQLEEVEGLELFDYPLDYEINQEGDYYQDPNIDEENITWQYTVVPANYSFSNGINYQILDDIYLPPETTNGESIEDQAFSLCGLSSKQNNKALRYNPQGNILVASTHTGTNIGLNNVKVVIHNWFKIFVTHTDASGHFSSSKRFFSAKVRFAYKNNKANIKAIRGIRVWRMAYCLKQKLNGGDKYYGNSLTLISHIVVHNTDISTTAARNWAAASTMNAIEDMPTLCISEGIPSPPNHLNVWVTNWTGDCSAPMLKKMANSSMLVGITYLYLIYFGHPYITAISAVLQQFLPDITIGYDGNLNTTERIAELTYNELAHSIHYAKVGNSYWLNYVSYIVLHLGYGDENTNNHELCALCESWAEHVEAYFRYLHYDAPSLTQIRLLESYPNAWNNWPWIPNGVMLDLFDNIDFWNYISSENTNIADNVDGIILSDVFNQMNSSVKSPVGLKLNLEASFPAQSTQIERLFNDYGY